MVQFVRNDMANVCQDVYRVLSTAVFLVSSVSVFCLLCFDGVGIERSVTTLSQCSLIIEQNERADGTQFNHVLIVEPITSHNPCDPSATITIHNWLRLLAVFQPAGSAHRFSVCGIFSIFCTYVYVRSFCTLSIIVTHHKYAKKIVCFKLPDWCYSDSIYYANQNVYISYILYYYLALRGMHVRSNLHASLVLSAVPGWRAACAAGEIVSNVMSLNSVSVCPCELWYV